MNELKHPDLQIRIERRPSARCVVIHVVGEVDLVSAPALRASLDEQLEASAALLVNLTETAFFGAAGLSELVHAAAVARDRAVRLAVAAGRPVLRPLQVTGLDRQLATYPDLAAAAEAISEPELAPSL